MSWSSAPFQTKPKRRGRYADFFEKIESYVDQISGPGISKFGQQASPLTHNANTGLPPDPIFKFPDTLPSRANISDLRAKFENEIVAVIGVGTGGYLLDLLAKTPVREIRIFDLDDFHVHNAYRSPGKLEEHELGKLPEPQLTHSFFRGVLDRVEYRPVACFPSKARLMPMLGA